MIVIVVAVVVVVAVAAAAGVVVVAAVAVVFPAGVFGLGCFEIWGFGWGLMFALRTRRFPGVGYGVEAYGFRSGPVYV